MKYIKILREDLIFSNFINTKIKNNYKSMLNTKEQIIKLLENKFNKSWDQILKINYK